MAMKRLVLPVAGAVLALSMIGPAFAHHGWGGYQEAETDVIGTVVERVSLAGAHASLKLRGEDGKLWDVVLPPPRFTFTLGIEARTIPLGAIVKAHGHRHRDANKFEMKTEQITMGERTFSLYPGRWN